MSTSRPRRPCASVVACGAPLFALLLALLTISETTTAQSAGAQSTGTSPAAGVAGMTRDELTAFAKLEVAVSVARDSAQFQLALARNKTPDTQQQLRAKLQAQIAELLSRAGTTRQEYERKTFLVSTDAEARKQFDALVAQITGVPTPGLLAVSTTPVIRVPAGAAGVHIGHVVNAFGDTPMGQGLLPTAQAEARTSAQHATLAARTPADLDAMKLHAGHVLHAIDPTIVSSGPGLGYGMRKAALGVASHIELAAKAQGASPNVVSHATHIATAARAALARADRVIALAQQVQSATSATEAAALVSQLVSLTSQLTTGIDGNGDGKIGWQESEGGLQQAQEHVTLMLAAETVKP